MTTTNTKQTERALCALRELVRAQRALKHEREAFYSALAALRPDVELRLRDRLTIAEHTERNARRDDPPGADELAALLAELKVRG
jgi:hypothetical protein